jgi:hypothetical protein
MSGAGRSLRCLGLIAADLLARQAQLPGDRLLLDALIAGIADRAAKGDLRRLDALAGGLVRVAGSHDISHRVGHLPIMTRGVGLQP